jgi:hypothetical protein
VPRGARHGSVRFVVGYLDLIGSRAEFVGLVRKADKPTLVIYGNETTPRSGAEMEALGGSPKLNMPLVKLAPPPGGHRRNATLWTGVPP